MYLDILYELINKEEDKFLDEWMKEQLKSNTLRSDLMSEKELKEESRSFLVFFKKALKNGKEWDPKSENWEEVAEFLRELSKTRAYKDFNPSETATFILSIKQVLLKKLFEEKKKNISDLEEFVWSTTKLIDQISLYTTESFINIKEQMIDRQHRELMELSTPVIKLWEGVLVLPIIGTMDSERTQNIMENLLKNIKDTGAETAIIDITGVPLIDTLTAQHLLKTVKAANLMGTECIISGIRPHIAQTIVNLGVDLAGIETKYSLDFAFKEAIDKLGYKIVLKD